MSDQFSLNWGSDFTVQFNWPDGAGGNANLTGYAVSLIDLHPALAGQLTATLVTPASGLIRLDLPWSDTLPRGRTASFRLRVTSPGGVDATTNLLWFAIQ
jgi:hypothetical protein